MDCSASGDRGHGPGARADECGHGRCPSPLTPGLTFLEQLPLQPRSHVGSRGTRAGVQGQVQPPEGG